MAPVVDSSADVAERRLQRLEHRYRRAQVALASARALHSALGQTAGPTTPQLLYAQRRVEEAEQYLLDLQAAIERAEDQTAVA